MEFVAISEIVIKERYRKDLGNIDALAQNIAEIGLLHPIVITPDKRLIAGYRRLEACRKLGWAEVPVRIINLDVILNGEWSENEFRKDFTPTERVAIAKALEERERERAAQRKAEGQRKGGKERWRAKEEDKEELSGNLPESKKHRREAKEVAARQVGWSRKTYEKAKEIVEAAEKEPEKYGDLVERLDKTGKVSGVYKQYQRRKQAEEIKKEPPPLPEGPFRVIVADPPWSYYKRAEDVTQRGQVTYPTMTVDEIKATPVKDIAHQDAILWLWTTNAHLPDAFEVMRAWGFEYKTMLTWVKDKIGLGDWLRGQTEHCLLGVRGNPVVTLTNQTTVIYGKVREHSRKPEEFYKLVEALCPGSKVELFAREPRKGWESHGNDRFAFVEDARRSQNN
ncbi:MAG: MT-A70 family methyltransferase [Candidatus Freyarchaeota archaeon]